MNGASACNWCSNYTELLPGKKYCGNCAVKSFRECCRCHRPFDHPKYFKLDPHKNRCDACQRKVLHERIAAKMPKSKFLLSESEDSEHEDGTTSAVLVGSGDSTDEEINKKTDRKPKAKLPGKSKPAVVVKSTKPKVVRKKKNLEAEALKNLICEWSNEESCMRRILDGKKLALVPIFL